ncbi:hydantoinase/oxoprolinase family protein [Methylobacter sp. S3L5C]|uniref:hydantoinase/oxoprolinase family protein n=1 Tax=Methylobacter sp. S3L5C TaxID=2839024 RepID=UPI001FABF442|nr:hydantoinase/oxoprolinase family protein [Methylobacter sp. S3L5C]UOA10366.1 H4MPT-linked C1 transfer pathway protein [Methylobacter sp. S3L5C]
MTQTNIMGWDIGGAHVKAAVINPAGKVIAVYQQPCPLWKGLDQLRSAVTRILDEASGRPYQQAITMTGELVDLFEDRDDGVKQIIETMTMLLPKTHCLVFAGQQGFLESGHIQVTDYQAIASANWLASASFAAQKVGNGLFVDIGSTTTDILLLNDGKVLAQGYTDYQRLISQELIYTGIVRTAVMAVAQTARDQDQEIGIMAEYFATMADVYRVTGELNELHDQTETADGAEKTITASARRLSRMIGSDFFLEELPRWQQFAKNIRVQQLQKIQRGCEHRIKNVDFSKTNPLIGAGVGRFLVKQIAQSLDYPYLDFSDLFLETINQTGLSTADCAPAVAVACLAKEFF